MERMSRSGSSGCGAPGSAASRRSAASIRCAAAALAAQAAANRPTAQPAPPVRAQASKAQNSGYCRAEVENSSGAKAPIVVAFHQARSSAAEYAPIAPRLVNAGFTVLAIDQRSGDGAFGGTNRTAAGFARREVSYDAALPDLEAALAWAKAEARGAPVVVWGSSYSAALVFLLAERFKVTQAVGRYKATAGLPPADPGREAAQVERLRALAVTAKLDPEFSEKFLRFIIDEVIRHHEQLRE